MQEFLILFAFASVLGWVIEVLYHLVTKKKVINRGFHLGPYLPLYGFGAVVLYFISSLDVGLLLKIFLFVFAMTLIEFITGLIFIKLLNLKLWDYSKNRWNLWGVICPLFSFYWLVLSLVFYFVIYPSLASFLAFSIENQNTLSFVALFYVLLIVDFSVRIVRVIMRDKKLIDLLDFTRH